MKKIFLSLFFLLNNILLADIHGECQRSLIAYTIKLNEIKASQNTDDAIYFYQTVQKIVDQCKHANVDDDFYLDEVNVYGLKHLKKVVVKDSAVDAICHGADVYVRGISKVSKGIGKGEPVLIETLKGEAVGFGSALMNYKDMLNAEKGVAVNVERVFMDRGTYPKMWKGKK